MSDERNTLSTISHFKEFHLSLAFEGIAVGVFAGFIVVLYRFVLEKIGLISREIYLYLSSNYHLLPLWLMILAVVAFIVHRIVKNEPMTKGSGIPQVEGVLLRQFQMNWWKVIVGKFIGGVLSLGAGLSLGREGPSIQLGAAAGQGVSRIFKRPNIEEKYLITGGASAGLAAAFNAPLSGVIFALEEVHKNFSPLVLLTSMSAAVTADMVSKEFFGMKPILDFHLVKAIPLHYYMVLLLLGVVLGILGALFNYCLLKTQAFYSWINGIPEYCKMLIPFIAAGFIGLFIPQALGGGHDLIMSLTGDGMILRTAALFLVVKFLFTMISYGSGAPGGIFLPMLAIGALIGSIYGHAIALLFHFDMTLINNIIVLAMAGYFTAVVRAPVTGCILISEMTGSFSHLLSLAIVAIIAYIVADILHSKPIYESLLEKMLRTKETDDFIGDRSAKSLLEIAVSMGTVLEGKRIMEIKWPPNCLLVSIKRGNEDIIPNGETMILTGDYLVVLVDEYNAAATKQQLLKMANNVVIQSE